MHSTLRSLVVFLAAVGFSVAFSPLSTSHSPRRKNVVTGGQRPDREVVTMMPLTLLEKEAVRSSGPAVLDRPQVEEQARVEEPVKERRRLGSEAWEVRIYNDGVNTREHVARSLVQVTGMSEMVAYQTMMQAHQNGIAVVGRWVYEVAEMYHDALRKNGIVCDIVPVDEDL